ncbi:MAG: hypothetical protein GY851_32130 [bacterium]|nr:hypothetical protein [bacterium]
MKSCFKTIVALIGLVLIVIGVGAILIATQVERTVKASLEKSLTYVYQTPVVIDEVQVSVLDGSVTALGLTVANPPGFVEAPAMRFGRVIVRFDMPSLLSSSPTIEEIRLEELKVNLRYELREGTNLGQLAKNADRLHNTESKDTPRGAKRSFVVKEVRVEEARIDLSANVLPLSSIEMKVSPFSLNEIDNDTPVRMSEMSVVFIRNLLTEGVTLKGALKPVGERLRSEFEKLTRDDKEASATGDAAADEDAPSGSDR